jgi:serine/threonine-protein kinase
MGSERAEGDAGGVEACAVGSVISGKYEVVRVLGQGAMGVVVAARHIELDEIVAIKFIHPDMHSVPDIVSRFAREAKACARLGSEHIAKVLDVGVAPAIGPYIVMEYLEGHDLGSVLRKRGTLPVHRACEYVMQVCEALALAHAAGIIHRDVKPDNLFLTRRGNLDIVKVLDFGISKAPLAGKVFGGELRMTETACLMGTPLYMSPEQIRATHEVDRRSDIWSLGVVLFELLTGRTAFSGETVTQVCALVLEGPTPRLIDHCRTAPPALAAVIDRCLMKDPAQRYQHAADLAHALLPFAPSRARLHAERASSVLRRDSASLVALAGGHDSGPVAAAPTPPSVAAVAGGIARDPVRVRLQRLVHRAGGRRLAGIVGGAAAIGLALMVTVFALAAPAAPPRVSLKPETSPEVAPGTPAVAPAAASRVVISPLSTVAAPPPIPPPPAGEPHRRSAAPSRARPTRQAAAAKLAQAQVQVQGRASAAVGTRAVDDLELPPLPAAPETSSKVAAQDTRVRLLEAPARVRRLD